MDRLDMGYYNRKDAEQYIDSHTEDMIIIIDMIRRGVDRIEIIQMIRTDPKLSLFDCSNIYKVLVWQLTHK
jgi:hypothetical protein